MDENTFIEKMLLGIEKYGNAFQAYSKIRGGQARHYKLIKEDEGYAKSCKLILYKVRKDNAQCMVDKIKIPEPYEICEKPSITSDEIINIVCLALKLDRDEVVKQGRNSLINSDGKSIAVTLIRQNVKIPKPTRDDPDRLKAPTYKEIAYIFKKASHKTIIDAELECKKLLKVDKKFKEKYDRVMDLLNPADNENVA